MFRQKKRYIATLAYLVDFVYAEQSTHALMYITAESARENTLWWYVMYVVVKGMYVVVVGGRGGVDKNKLVTRKLYKLKVLNIYKIRKILIPMYIYLYNTCTYTYPAV